MSAPGIQASGAAGQVRFLVTNGGAHPSAKWAEVTTLDLIALDPSLAGPRLEAAIALRRGVQRDLLDVFECVKPTLSAEQIHVLATDVMGAICDRAKGSDWYASFMHPQIWSAMHTTIRRNLATAADIAIALD